MASRAAARAPKHPAPRLTPVPRWFQPLFLGLTAIFLMGLFSPEAADTDFWWHLKTGQYIVQQHTLPVPDPFSFTSSLGPPAYPGEPLTRYFNLTHEWLSQILIYLAYLAGGFGGVVLFRAAVLTGFCALVGLIAYRRCGGFYRSWAAALAAASIAVEFAHDRPYILSLLLLALTVAMLEYRRRLRLLPLVFVIWANCHGGFFLGWIIVGAYSAEALLERLRKRPAAGDKELWVVSALAVLASGLNPNGFHIIQVLLYYRRSFLTSTLQEWGHPPLWPPNAFVLLLAGAVITLLWARRRVRTADWLLFGAFAAAAWSAQRNISLIGFLAPILLAAYVPWSRPVPRMAGFALAALVASTTATLAARGDFFQLRAALWKFPAGAADFLAAHRTTAPMFNSYEYGGYLIWRLAPREKVFVDGRALNENVFRDYTKILYNVDQSAGKSSGQLLDQYGIQVILMNGFEYISGTLYNLAPGLADPNDSTWKLVYSDDQAIIYMRQPPPGVQPLDKLTVFDHLEAECALHLAHEPEYSLCARSLGEAFAKVGDKTRAQKWYGIYLAHPHDADPAAVARYGQLAAEGH